VKLIESIRIFIGRFLLKRNIQKFDRIKAVHNLKSAKSIGIVYEYKNENEFKIVENLIDKLRGRKIEVKVLVFLPYEKLLEYIPQKLSIDFITHKDLNSVCQPIGQRPTEFIAKQFDILIDLNTNKMFSLEYVTAMSRAFYKLGVYDENKQQVYDLMLKMPTEDNLSNIVEQSLHYLNMLNPA